VNGRALADRSVTGDHQPAHRVGGPFADTVPVVTEPLTDRERTVLARMGQAMSTEDIAVELFLSVNTIKTHQKSIYRKLSVARRNDAVRRGRELQII
jgi:LuxR family maltose regulon positive regulatory protein